MEETEILGTDIQPNTNFYKFLIEVIRYRWFIVITSVVSVLITVVAVFNMKNIYAASVNVVPPKKSSSGMEGLLGNVASTLKDIGLAKVGGNKGGTGYDFMVIFQSRTLKDSLISKFNLTEVYDIPFSTSKDSLYYYTRLELEDNFLCELLPEGNYQITVNDVDPQRAQSMANYTVIVANNIAQDLDRIENRVLIKQFEDKLISTDSLMRVTSDSLGIYSKESLIYAPLEQAKAAALAVAESKAQVLQQQIGAQLLSQQFGDDDPKTQLQKQFVKELETKVNNLEHRPGFIGNFSLKDAPKAAYQYLKFYTELEALMKLKSLLIPSFEQTKLDQTKNSPSLYVLDPAVLPVKKVKPRRLSFIIGSFCGSLVLSIFYVLIRIRYVEFKKNFESVRKSLLSDKL
ncbi:MAG: hypothetical protein U0Y96_13190 [Candidatus Kapaibacterium sp.]|nr:hypothetical protein [Bacteroidota bacterium]